MNRQGREPSIDQEDRCDRVRHPAGNIELAPVYHALRHFARLTPERPVHSKPFVAPAFMPVMRPAEHPNPDEDPAAFLDTAGRGCGVSSYTELWRWLQEDVQHWLPHDILMVGWRDSQSASFESEIVSSLAGLDSRQLTPSWADGVLGHVRDCWVACGMRPCEVDMVHCSRLVREFRAPSAQAIAGMRTALVHGTRDGVRGGERMVVAFTRAPALPAACGAALRLLQPIIDTAVRRLPRMDLAGHGCAPLAAAAGLPQAGALSGRERQIMEWVALGKTNPEIGDILCISEFTVKNHMKSIFRKLDVTNRAQAVARLAVRPDHA
jgi:transcriptional regulator EpsA